jgi:hypothetical protein
MRTGLVRRLAKMEERLTARSRTEKLADCNCRLRDLDCLDGPLLVKNEAEFEAEMNLRCPTHGFRHLGQLLILKSINVDGTLADASLGLGRLVDEYDHRRSEFLKSHPEFENDFEQF